MAIEMTPEQREQAVSTAREYMAAVPEKQLDLYQREQQLELLREAPQREQGALHR